MRVPPSLLDIAAVEDNTLYNNVDGQRLHRRSISRSVLVDSSFIVQLLGLEVFQTATVFGRITLRIQAMAMLGMSVHIFLVEVLVVGSLNSISHAPVFSHQSFLGCPMPVLFFCQEFPMLSSSYASAKRGKSSVTASTFSYQQYQQNQVRLPISTRLSHRQFR